MSYPSSTGYKLIAYSSLIRRYTACNSNNRVQGAMGIIRLTYFDISDLPISYISASDQAFVYTAAITRVLPSQQLITTARVEYYDRHHRMLNDDGELPFGIIFAGSNTIHLVDGHHRWFSCLARGRKRFRLLVDQYDYSYSQAIIDAYIESHPAPAPLPKPARTPRQPVPVIRVRQLPLAVF